MFYGVKIENQYGPFKNSDKSLAGSVLSYMAFIAQMFIFNQRLTDGAAFLGCVAKGNIALFPTIGD
jgi:uncharacterized membrane protein (GlpM family)